MQSAGTQVVNFTIDVQYVVLRYRSLHLVSGQWSVVTPVRLSDQAAIAIVGIWFQAGRSWPVHRVALMHA